MEFLGLGFRAWGLGLGGEFLKEVSGNRTSAQVSSCSPCPPGAAFLGLRFEVSQGLGLGV